MTKKTIQQRPLKKKEFTIEQKIEQAPTEDLFDNKEQYDEMIEHFKKLSDQEKETMYKMLCSKQNEFPDQLQNVMRITFEKLYRDSLPNREP